MSNFEFCKVHFYYCYIMWKLTLIYLRGKSVNSLLFESVFIFLVFILTFDRTICNTGPLGADWLERGDSPSSPVSLSYPKALIQTKATTNVPFSRNFIMCSSLSEPLAPILT